MSNMISNTDGDILFYHTSTSATDTDTYGINTIRKWVHESDNTLATKAAFFITKDITFGNINVKKKLYRVYITYKTSSDSGVAVTGAVNGNAGSFNVAFSDSSKFINTSTSCYGSSTLDSTGDVWKTAELKFSTPSLVNNITSFQLQLSGASTVYDFEVNDISISYRVKNVK